MVSTPITHALDSAKAVKTYDDRPTDLILVWHGGTQITAYTTLTPEQFDEITAHSISDEHGKPLDRDEILDHMDGLAKLHDTTV